MEDKFLENVFGYRAIKEELKTILDWYLDNNMDEQKRTLLPRGILFYGEPGEGKTHLAREYSKAFDYPVYVIEGNSDNVQDEIVTIYKNAKKEKNAIVIIDEMDRLIEKDTKLTRIIMSQLDGFDKKQNIITLATVNDYYSLPEALLRDGRFDRKFKVNTRDKKDIEDIIVGFSKMAGLNLGQYEIDELVDDLFFYSANEIRSIFNNVSLKYGDKATVNDVLNTADFLATGYVKKSDDYEVKRNVAIHEAGHALFIYKYSQYEKFMRIYFEDYGGRTVYKDVDIIESKESRIDTIRCALAGLVAEELVFGKLNIGSGRDLERAYDLSYRLVNRSCVFGLDNYCSNEAWSDKRFVSEYSKKIFEKKANKFLKKNYLFVKRCLKKEVKTLNRLADYLVKHKEIKRDEFKRLINSSN